MANPNPFTEGFMLGTVGNKNPADIHIEISNLQGRQLIKTSGTLQDINAVTMHLKDKMVVAYM